MVAEVVDDQLKRKRRYAEEVQSEQASKKIVAHTALANKFYAIRTLNKQPVEWTVAQMKTMAMWYKQADHIPLPTTMKQLLLTKYHGHMMHGNAAVSVATVMPPLPHPSVTLISQQDMMGGPPV